MPPSTSRSDPRPVAVLGATGYIGARLVPRLAEAGWRVRAIGRNPAKLAGRPWAGNPEVEIAAGNVFDPPGLEAALELTLTERADGSTEVRQRALSRPRGLLGLAYWYGILPLHNLVFAGMLRGIARAAGARILAGLERLPGRGEA